MNITYSIQKLVTCVFLFICTAVALLIIASSRQANALQPRLIPDPKTYQAFLLNEWKPGIPTLIAFKDPFCPYCIRDLKKRSQLENHNVFLFWSPILSSDSALRAKAFFHCDQPTSERVINAVINHQPPHCNGVLNQRLFELNQGMVASYDPSSVPQYWLGGRRVSLSSLTLNRPVIDADIIAKLSPLKIDWLRYQGLSINQPVAKRHGVAVVLPDSYRLDAKVLFSMSRSTQYNWYLFTNHLDQQSESQLWCKRWPTRCSRPLSNRELDYPNKEFRLLAGLEQVREAVFLLDGKRLQEREITYLIPKDIRAILH